MSSIKEFLPLWKQWYIEEQISRDVYGCVYKAVKKDDYGKYASIIKHIEIPLEGITASDLVSFGVISDEASAPSYYERVCKRVINEINVCYSLKGNSNIVSYEEHFVSHRADNTGFDLFVRMEHLTPLNYCTDKATTEKDVIKLGIDICNALILLEKKGIVHGDIKPANIFVNSDDTFKLGYFGEGKVLKDAMDIQTGKPSPYMAPELLNPHSLSKVSDIYSLGTVMYTLLNNYRKPFIPDDVEIITGDLLIEADRRRFSNEKMNPPKNCSKELADIILKACEFSPADRWQNAEALKKALTDYSDKLNYNKNQFDFYADEKTIGRDSDNLYNGYSNHQQGYPLNGFENVSSVNNTQDTKPKGTSKALIVILILCVLILLALIGVFVVGYNNNNESSSAENSTEKVTEAITEFQNNTEPITDSVLDEKPKEVEVNHPTEKAPKPSATEPKKKSDIVLPSYYNQDSSVASTNIQSMGLVANIEYVYSDTINEGYVVNQDYSPGTTLSVGTVVTLYVSKGKQYQSSSSTITSQSVEYVYADTYSYLTLRSGNSFTTDPIAFLPSATMLTVLERYDKMIKVETPNGDIGYVNKDYVVNNPSDYDRTGFGTPLSDILYPLSTKPYSVKDGITAKLYNDHSEDFCIKELKSGTQMYIIDISDTDYVHVVLADSSSGNSEGFVHYDDIC